MTAHPLSQSSAPAPATVAFTSPADPIIGADAATTTTATTTAPTTTDPTPPRPHQNGRSRELTGASAAAASQFARARADLEAATRRFSDFPTEGIDFVDILPLFADPAVHGTLIENLHLLAVSTVSFGHADVVVGLEARGFLFGPSLALRLRAGFAPVRKKGKLPGPCVTAAYEKEYGSDFFQMQADGVRPGQRVLVVDDVIATGGSARAAADLVRQLGGIVVGFVFLMEMAGLGGREKLGDDAPVGVLLGDD